MDETERDAERWRKLVALLQHSYDADDVETDELYLTARMLSARGESRRVAVTLSFSDERDQPLDLASAIDAAPWPEPARDDAAEAGAKPGPGCRPATNSAVTPWSGRKVFGRYVFA